MQGICLQTSIKVCLVVNIKATVQRRTKKSDKKIHSYYIMFQSINGVYSELWLKFHATEKNIKSVTCANSQIDIYNIYIGIKMAPFFQTKIIKNMLYLNRRHFQTFHYICHTTLFLHTIYHMTDKIKIV